MASDFLCWLTGSLTVGVGNGDRSNQGRSEEDEGGEILHFNDG